MTQHEDTPEQTVLDKAADLVGEFTVSIEDGYFRVAPAEAGIAMLASLDTANEQIAAAWDECDKVAMKLEALREENAMFRDHLEGCMGLLEQAGHGDYVDQLNRILWSVTGVNSDGTTFPFTYGDNEQ